MFSFKITSKFAVNTNSTVILVIRKMCNTNQELKEIFLNSVQSVQPDKLIQNEIKVGPRHLSVRGQTCPLNKPCLLVGFGKAVLGMATAIEDILGNHLQMGIVSVPPGIFENYPRPVGSKIEYLEGAKDNLPDENAVRAAGRIKDLVQGLTEDDLLIVLISGGGSALLPLPIPPITLGEKLDVIKKLTKKGADIRELNCLRKQISTLKGGGLARLAHPCRIISLVLSDIVGDPLDFIASGPTIPNADENAAEVLKKYGLYEEIPDSIKAVLRSRNQFPEPAATAANGEYTHVRNYIIGNNTIAARAAQQEALCRGIQSAVVSTQIEGDVNRISRIYARLARELSLALSGGDRRELKTFLEKTFSQEVRVEPDFIDRLLDMDFSRRICLIFAGEPTVVVKGSGKGGRNQQLSLAFSAEINKAGAGSADISFLSCGTDGVDGPTDAAGAIGDSRLVRDSMMQGINPEEYLDNNDSYGFYERYNGGRNLVRIGHTGTNVMDIHVMIVAPKCK